MKNKVLSVILFSIPMIGVSQKECQTCAQFVAGAYLRVNPIFEFYYGDLESFVTVNKKEFAEGSLTIRCMKALTIVLTGESIRNYDATVYEAREALDAKLANAGLSTGNHPASASEMYSGMAAQFERLSRVLPPLAQGDSRPLYTPTTELEEMQILATRMLKEYMKDPMVAATFKEYETEIKELADMDYQMIVKFLQNLNP